jgi:hypothetical protein
MDGEAVAEDQGLALGEVGQDVALVDGRLLHIGQADEDHVGATDRLGGVVHLEAVLLRDRARFRAGIEADDHVASAVLQVQRVGVALRAVTQHG